MELYSVMQDTKLISWTCEACRYEIYDGTVLYTT